MDTAVIKLNSLADAVGAATEDDDFFSVGFLSLVFLLVGRIIVGCIGLEFGSTGIHQFIYRQNILFFPQLPDIILRGTGQICQLLVGETSLFAKSQEFRIQPLKTALGDFPFCFDDLL